MSIKHYKYVWKNYPGKKGSHKLVFLALADFANDETDTCWPSISAIAEMVGISGRQVSRALHDLEVEGYIEVQPGRGRNITNLYKIPCENMTPMSPLRQEKHDTHDQKGDIHDVKHDTHVTFTETENMTSGVENMTSGAQKHDMGVIQTVIEPEMEPEEKSALPSVDGLALLMARGKERFEHNRRNGGVRVAGWQTELNKQLAPAQRVPLVETLAQACGLTAAMEDDTIFHDLHEYAVKFSKAGYTAPDAIRDLKAKWSADNWRREKHPMPSLISFFKFASQMAEMGVSARDPTVNGSINFDLSSI